MTPIAAIAQSVVYFTVASLLLAVISAAFMLAVEELGFRLIINRGIVRHWLRRVPSEVPWSPSAPFRLGPPQLSGGTYALPYRQLVGVLSALAQADPNKVAGGGFATAFFLLGLTLMRGHLSLEDFNDFRARSAELDDARLLLVIERGIDDLQTIFARNWALVRYSLALFSVASLSIALAYQSNAATEPSMLRSIMLYPMLMVVATAFTPLVRDLLEQMTARQR